MWSFYPEGAADRNASTKSCLIWASAFFGHTVHTVNNKQATFNGF
jgi:hypothetical protein